MRLQSRDNRVSTQHEAKTRSKLPIAIANAELEVYTAIVLWGVETAWLYGFAYNERLFKRAYGRPNEPELIDIAGLERALGSSDGAT